MTAVNRTSLFNANLPFIGDSGRKFRVLRIRFPTQVSQSGGAGAGARYYFMAYDSGTAGQVTWGPFSTILTNPSSTQTRPNYTGTLSDIRVISGP